ncbi:MAG: hypothetical protein ACI8ZN_001510 [Bacteroidia bacterium]|jgi:hypothetical protein
MKGIKAVVFIILCISAFSAKAQDVLQLTDSSKIDVRIDQIDEDGRLIYYTVNNEKAVISFEAVTKYYYKNTWHTLPTKTRPKIFFGYIIVDKKCDWRIHTNLAGLLNKDNENNFKGFQSSKFISIEPEYLIGKWAFQLPIVIGVDNRRVLNSEVLYYNGRHNYFVSGYKEEIPQNSGYEGLPNFRKSSGSISYNDTRDGHYVQTRFQIGVKPKYYFLNHRERSFYLAVGLSYGVGDFGSITDYQTLTYIDEYNYRYWYVNERKITTIRNTFSYFRQEVQLGFEVNLRSRLSITLEVGISSTMKNKGPIQDILYARQGTRAFEKVAQYDYRPDEFGGVVVANFYLGYRLAKRRTK